MGLQKTFRLAGFSVRGIAKLAARKMIAGRTAAVLLLVYGVMALGLMAPSASSNRVIPQVFDLEPHLSLIVQARIALEEGQFPIRVSPWQFDNWRYPTYQYYGQLPHTVGGLIYKYITPDNPYTAYLILVWLSLVVGAFYTYRTSFWLTHSRIGAALAGMLYMASPYFLINIHSRGALAETVGMGVLPVVVYYALRSYAKRSVGTVLLSGLGWFLLVAAHTITFVYASMFVLLWLFIAASNQLHRHKTRLRLARVGLGYLLGWLLAAYYLGPLLLQQNGLYIQYTLTDPYNTNELTPISGLLSPTSVPPFPGFIESPGLHPAIGWPMLGAWGAVLYFYFAQGRMKRWPLSLRRTGRYIPGLLILFLLALFMTWSSVDFWPRLPKQLQIAQFPYRLLSQVAWVGALLIPYALVLLVRKLEALHFAVGIVIVGLFASSYLPVLKPAPISVEQIVKEPDIGYGRVTYLYEPKVTELYANEELPLYDGRVTLLLDRDFNLPGWPAGAKPVLHLQGSVTLKTTQPDVRLSLFINGEKVGQTPLKAGPLGWDVPLEKTALEGKPFVLKFVVKPSTMAQITINSLTLSGLPLEQTLIGLSETQAAFHQQGLQTVGQVTIKDNIPRMVQLPVLYYPNLLEVRLDGKRVDYVGLPKWIFTLIGLKLEQGTHQISVEFVGLQWANLVSLVAWVLLLLGLLGCLVLKGIKIAQAKNQATALSYPEEKVLIE